MSETSIRDAITDAIRYWEKLRVAYNAILLTMVISVITAGWPDSGAAFSTLNLQRLFLLAVVANVFYCAAYIPDVVAQYSGFRDTWRCHRWILFALGTTFASIIARFVSLDMFGPAGV